MWYAVVMASVVMYVQVHWYLVHDLFHYFLMISVAIPILQHFNVFDFLYNMYVADQTIAIL